MEETTNSKTVQKKKALRTILISAGVIVVAGGLWLYSNKQDSFCFNFAHDTQFGDKVIENPSNKGFIGPKGTEYYIPEVPALQTTLKKEGFYIDDFETTGGGVYLTSFFGPSTKAAVIEFQKRYSISPTGQVDNDTLDALRSIYGCPEDAATSTESYSVSTTTIE